MLASLFRVCLIWGSGTDDNFPVNMQTPQSRCAYSRESGLQRSTRRWEKRTGAARALNITYENSEAREPTCY